MVDNNWEDPADKLDTYRNRYEESEKGKATRDKYESGEVFKATQKRYRQKDKGKLAHQRYRNSDKGKEAQERAKERRNQTNSEVAELLKLIEERRGRGECGFCGASDHKESQCAQV